MPGRSESPGRVPRSCKTSTTQLSRSPTAPRGCRSPRAAPPAPWRGERSWSCACIPRAAGARRWAKRLGFTLPKTPQGGAAPLPPDLPGCFLASRPAGFLPAVPSGRVISFLRGSRFPPALPAAQPARCSGPGMALGKEGAPPGSFPLGKTPRCLPSLGLTGSVCQAQEGRSPPLIVDFSAPSLQKAFSALANQPSERGSSAPAGEWIWRHRVSEKEKLHLWLLCCLRANPGQCHPCC